MHQTFSISWLLTLLLVFSLAGPIINHSSPVGASPPTSVMHQPAKVDVVIFVHVLGDDARVGIAYDRLVSKAEVQEDIQRLVSVPHWYPVNIEIDNTPFLPKQAPTTAVLLTLLKSPQVTSSVPNVQPYVEAFQRFKTLEIDFLLPQGGGSYTATAHGKDFDAALTYQNGLYHYSVSIKKHKGPLDNLNEALRVQDTSHSSARQIAQQTSSKKTAGIDLVRNVTIGGIALLLMIAIVYFVRTRRR